MWWFTPSLSYVGQGESEYTHPRLSACEKLMISGIIMGFPVTVSMNLGMIVGWAVLSPLSKHLGWAPGPVSSTTNGARGWIVSSYSFFPSRLIYREILADDVVMGRSSDNDIRIDNIPPPATSHIPTTPDLPFPPKQSPNTDVRLPFFPSGIFRFQYGQHGRLLRPDAGRTSRRCRA